MSTAAQLQANHHNAALSTGPKTAEGKSRSSLNAVKTGLTGRTVLLPSDDAEAYRAHLAQQEATWKPATPDERNVVQLIADSLWRLFRIPSLESGIYALGRIEFAGLFPECNEAQRSVLLDAHIHRTYRRDLSNLLIQEMRLRRQLEHDTDWLLELQTNRVEAEKARLAEAARLCRAAKQEGKSFDPAALGFEFSKAQIETRIAEEDKRKAAHAIADARSYAFMQQVMSQR